MIDSWYWGDQVIYSVWVYGGRYVVVLSYQLPFDEVVDRIREYAREQGLVDPSATIIVSAMNIAEAHADKLREDENLVSLILE